MAAVDAVARAATTRSRVKDTKDKAMGSIMEVEEDEVVDAVVGVAGVDVDGRVEAVATAVVGGVEARRRPGGS